MVVSKIKMVKSFFRFLTVVLFFSSSWASALSVYVTELKGVNVPEGEILALEDLVRSKVQDQLKHKLVGAVTDSDYVIGGRVVKLADAYSITLIKSKNSQEVYRATLKSAMMSDADVVVGRLVQSLDNEESVEKMVSTRDMTLDEQVNQRRRRDVLKQWFFGLGPIVANSLGIDDGGILWNIGYNFEMDYQWDMHLDLDYLSTHSHSESDGRYLGLNFGLNYYFSEANHSPMVETHISYGWTAATVGCSGATLFCSSADKASGWGLGAGLGYRFFRTANTNFSVILRGEIIGDKTEVTNETPMVSSLMLVGYFN